MSYDTPQHEADVERAPIGVLEVILGIALLAITVGAYLALVLTGHDDSVDKLLTFLSPVVAAVFIVGAQSRSHQRTTSRLKGVEAQVRQVVRQTNGVMDERIVSKTTEALEAYPLEERVKATLGDMLAERLTEDPSAGP